ncbi:hypothetical protein [Thermococcus sp. Bubb.Bath]|uniref:hypothetical protein n=1 Tax=Thermococcus sp. Bubb.Bath TaxID=1638242 RepID=UPI001F0E5746|nr:hypothetical protein [Thermococcus sp. Bubb.Bath]
MKLPDLLYLKSGRIMMSGNPKRIARIFLNEWAKEGYRVLAEELPFVVNGEVFVGNPMENPDFDVYFVVNPLSKSKAEKERLYQWLEERKDKLILLYEGKYVGDSITRYRIKDFIDYLIAYRWETVGTEVVKLYRLENGRVTESRELMRKS